jgi:hypothetical protein
MPGPCRPRLPPLPLCSTSEEGAGPSVPQGCGWDLAFQLSTVPHRALTAPVPVLEVDFAADVPGDLPDRRSIDVPVQHSGPSMPFPLDVSAHRHGL